MDHFQVVHGGHRDDNLPTVYSEVPFTKVYIMIVSFWYPDVMLQRWSNGMVGKKMVEVNGSSSQERVTCTRVS